MDNFLSLGLSSPHRLVQAMSLKGLSSLLMPPKKKVRAGGAPFHPRRTSGRRRHLKRASTTGGIGQGGWGPQAWGRRGSKCLGDPAVWHRPGDPRISELEGALRSETLASLPASTPARWSGSCSSQHMGDAGGGVLPPAARGLPAHDPRWALGSPVEREGEVAGGHKRLLQLEVEVVPREHPLGGSMAAGGSGGVSLPQVDLLQNRLAGLLDSFPSPDPKDLPGLMEVVGDILHCLGARGAGAFSLRIAQHLLPLFEDVRTPRLRSSAHQSEQRSCWPRPLSRGLWESPGGWKCPQ